MSRALLILGLAAAAIPAAGTAPAQGPVAPKVFATVDEGVYTVTVRGRRVGYEVFAFTIHYDSLFIDSEFRQPMRSGDTLRKNQMLVVRHFDSDLIFYRSVLLLPGHSPWIRGITVGDTVVTMYREGEAGGEGITHLKPGGRLYAVESNGYALLDLLFRELGSRGGWTERRVNLILLDRDSVVTSVARSLGADTLRWGSARVAARKFEVTVGPSAFYGWVGPTGAMLRLEQPELGLIVERDPAPAKREAKSAPAPKPAPASKGAPGGSRKTSPSG